MNHRPRHEQPAGRKKKKWKKKTETAPFHKDASKKRITGKNLEKKKRLFLTPGPYSETWLRSQFGRNTGKIGGNSEKGTFKKKPVVLIPRCYGGKKIKVEGFGAKESPDE